MYVNTLVFFPQMAEVLEKHRGGDMAEWERKQEDGKKRRRI